MTHFHVTLQEKPFPELWELMQSKEARLVAEGAREACSLCPCVFLYLVQTVSTQDHAGLSCSLLQTGLIVKKQNGGGTHP